MVLKIENEEFSVKNDLVTALIMLPVFALFVWCDVMIFTNERVMQDFLDKFPSDIIVGITCALFLFILVIAPIILITVFIIILIKWYNNVSYPKKSELKYIELCDNYVQLRFNDGKLDCRYPYQEVTLLNIVTHYTHMVLHKKYGGSQDVTIPTQVYLYFAFKEQNKTVKLTKNFNAFINGDYDRFMGTLKPYLSKFPKVEDSSEEVHLPT